MVAPPPACNPEWLPAELRARDWAHRFGLVVDEPEARRLARMGQGRMAGLVAPAAGPDTLELLARWGTFICLVDDGFDRGPEVATPREVRDLFDDLLAVLRFAMDGTHHPVPAVRALADLWRRTVAGVSPQWTARFVDHYGQFADATYAEAVHRERGTRLSLPEYVRQRRHTITSLPMLDLVERTAGPESPELDRLRVAAADTIAWTNDLASAAGEDTLVTVVARDRGCTTGEAVPVVRGMIERRLDEFDAAADEVLRSGPEPGRLGPRVAAIRTFRDGTVAWLGESGRYEPAPRTRRGVPRPRQLRDGIERLTRVLSTSVVAGGAMPDRCGSRVLESALLLALVRNYAGHDAEECELTRYLDDQRPSAGRLDRLLIDACLSPTPVSHVDAVDLDGGVAHFTGIRGHLKRVMIDVVLHVLSGAPLDPTQAPIPSRSGEGSLFADVNLLAVRVLQAHGTGRHQLVSDAERDSLIGTLHSGRHRRLWESIALTHLLALHAVRTYRPDHPVIGHGIAGLLLARNADGGIGLLDSQDMWLVAVGGLAFLADDRLRPLTGRMAEFIARGQAADGGWPYAAGITQTDVDTACRCVEFLRALGGRYAGNVDAGVRYLAAMAGPDGGFPTWIPGDTSDLDMTAGAVIALSHAWDRYPDLLDAAVSYVLDAQLPDGTFERSWTISESSVILRVVDALDLAPYAARVRDCVRRAVAHLLATQNRDGGWGYHPGRDSDVLSTAQTVPVVARHADPGAVRRAVDYLLAVQHDDGGFPSVPDQTGPRPVPLEFPVLANIFALQALTAADRTAPGAAPSFFKPLESRLRGRLVQPGDADYDHVRQPRNARYDHVRPRAVALVANADDVAACVAFARRTGTAVAVRSGGHSYAGHCTGPGLVVDVRGLDAIRIGDGRLRIGAGVTSGAAHRFMGAAGVGLPAARYPTVGMVGLTLGGGVSAFARAWGLTCDRLVAAELVTADGIVRRVDASGPDAELFWALRGGGGGVFGIVTALEYETVDIGAATFCTFRIGWSDRERIAVVRGWQHWMRDPPRELWSELRLLTTGPPGVHGVLIGPPLAAEWALERLVDAVGAEDTARSVTPCDYPRAALLDAGPIDASSGWTAKSHIVRAPLAEPAVAALVAGVDLLARTGGTGGVLLDSLGGRVADVAPHATAFPHRRGLATLQYLAVRDDAEVLRAVHEQMGTHLGTGAYVNYPDPELVGWESAYYGDNYPRLQAVKAAYDPGDLFAFAQSVRPRPGSVR